MNFYEKITGIYGKNADILSCSKDCTVFGIKNETGRLVLTCYEIFPGITLAYNDVHMHRCQIDCSAFRNIYEINHCREGRVEYETNDSFLYLSPGDLSVTVKNRFPPASLFPTGHYQGISVIIDTDTTPKCLSCILDDVNVNPYILMQKFCCISDCFIMRSTPQLEHIFSELYSVPDSIKKGYFKVKILELLLFLSTVEADHTQMSEHCYSKKQFMLAEQLCRFISDNMDTRITIDRLAEIFHVSSTQLKNSFKAVYGMSVYSYIRTQKMQSAAVMLKETDRTILDIAGQYGYDNGSKFAKAFHDVMGETPKQFRQRENKNDK